MSGTSTCEASTPGAPPDRPVESQRRRRLPPARRQSAAAGTAGSRIAIASLDSIDDVQVCCCSRVPGAMRHSDISPLQISPSPPPPRTPISVAPSGKMMSSMITVKQTQDSSLSGPACPACAQRHCRARLWIRDRECLPLRFWRAQFCLLHAK